MTGLVMKIRDDFVVKSAATLSTKNAWALYVRRRWPQNTVNHCCIEWDITDGEARGLVFAQASQRTIDKVLDHPRGGMRLALLITEIRFQTALQAWVGSEQERLAHEASRAAAEADALAAMARRLPSGLGLGGVRADRVGPRRTGDGCEVRSIRSARSDRGPE
jgi:hypothetical protein